MKIGLILQARMGSRRLPGKIFTMIGSRTLLDHIINRLKNLSSTYTLVIATTISTQDDTVEKWCRDKNCRFFRGSENDVLQRFYDCATKFKFDHIVRLTGDNPFIDVQELDNLIKYHIDTGADYTHSLSVLPVGVGAEIFTYESLERSFTNGHQPNHREHVNEYIQENPDLFNISVLEVAKEKRRPDVRLTVDTPRDLEKARKIIEMVKNNDVTTEDAIRVCLHCV